MEQVAQMLGVEIGEEFILNDDISIRHKLSLDGLFFYNKVTHEWVENNEFIYCLLSLLGKYILCISPFAV